MPHQGVMDYYRGQCEDLARRRGVTLEELLADPGLSKGSSPGQVVAAPITPVTRIFDRSEPAEPAEKLLPARPWQLSGRVM
jgi:hypothetical protein